MPITIEVKAPKRTLTIADTDTVEATYKHGAWRADYRGQSLYAVKLSNLQAVAEDLFHRQRESMTRARRLRTAEKNPVPAVDASTLKDVGVRGVDKRSGYLLIIDSNGERTSVPTASLLRPLTDEERQGLLNLQAVRDAAAEAVKRAPQPDEVNKLEKALDFTIEARYDFETEDVVGEYRGKTYRAPTPEKLRRAIVADIMLNDRPYALNTPSTVITAGEWLASGFDPLRYGRTCGVFADKRDADAYVEARHRHYEAQNALTTALGGYAFDASAFTEESTD